MRKTTATAALADQPVAAVMSRPVVAIRDADTLNRGLEAFAIAGVHHVAVVDAMGRCVGLLSDRIVAAAWLHYPMQFDRLRAGDVAILPQLPLIAHDAGVRDAAQAMHCCGTDAVVVVDGERRPVGILTAADLVTLIAEPPEPRDEPSEPDDEASRPGDELSPPGDESSRQGDEPSWPGVEPSKRGRPAREDEQLSREPLLRERLLNGGRKASRWP